MGVPLVHVLAGMKGELWRDFDGAAWNLGKRTTILLQNTHKYLQNLCCIVKYTYPCFSSASISTRTLLIIPFFKASFCQKALFEKLNALREQARALERIRIKRL